MFAFDIGAHGDILQEFQSDIAKYVARDVLEQKFVENQIKDIKYWPFDWVPSFKYHLRYKFCLNLLIRPKAPGPNARALAFHGDPRPIDLIKSKIWGEFPHLGLGPVRWFADYWRKYSRN